MPGWDPDLNSTSTETDINQPQDSDIPSKHGAMRILTFRSLRTLVFPRPGYSIPVRRPFVRVFSSTRFAPYLQSAPETVDVPVGSNGHVSLR